MKPEQDLLDAYITALQRNPKAPTPAGLDPALAQLARELVARRALPGSARRARMWQRARLLAGTSSNGKASQEDLVTSVSTTVPRRQPFSALSLLAAALVLLVLGLFLVPRPQPPSPLAQGISGTATPTAASTMTMTPITTLTFTPEATITSTPIPTASPTLVNPEPSLVPGALPSGDPRMPTLVPVEAPQQMPPTLAAPAEVIEIAPNYPGERLEGRLDADTPVVEYRFVAPASGVVVARLAAADPSQISLSHSVIRADNSGGGGGGGGGGGPAGLVPVPTYQMSFAAFWGDAVSVTVASTSGGMVPTDYVLSVVHLESIRMAFGNQAEMTLNDFVPLATYRFEGEAGDIANITVEGLDGYDARLILLDSMMTPITEDADGGPGNDPELYRFTLPYTGGYYLQIEPQAHNSAGRFRLTLSREAPLSLDAGPQVVTLNSQVGPQVTFEGRAGENVRLTVRLAEGMEDYAVQSLHLTVAQEGRYLTTFSRDALASASGSGSLFSGDFTVPADGTVQVSVVGSASQTDPTDAPFRIEIGLERAE